MEKTNFLQKELYLHKGAAVAQWQQTPPLAIKADFGQAAAFYENSLAAARAFYEKSLCEAAKSAYEADENPKKRFSFVRFAATYSAVIIYEDEGVLSVFRTFAWKRGADVLAEYRFAEVWARGGVLLPAFCFCEKKALQKAAKAAKLSLRALQKADFYIKGEQLVFLTPKGDACVLRTFKEIPSFFTNKAKKHL